MPEIVAESEVKEQFGTSLSDVIKQELSRGGGDQPTVVEKPTKTEPKADKPAPVKEEKPAVKVDPNLPPETVFDDTPAVKPEVKVEGQEPQKAETPAELKGKSRENFEKLATEKYEVEKKSFNLEKQLKEAEAKLKAGDPTAQTKIQQLEQQLGQVSAIAERADLELRPAFQQSITIPRQQALEAAKTAFKDSGGDPAQVEAALALSGKSRVDRLDELIGEVSSTIQQTKLKDALVAVDRLDGTRQQALSNHRAWLQKLNEQDSMNRHQALEQHAKLSKANLEDALVFLRDEAKFEVFKEVDDPNYAWWNEGIPTMKQNAEHLLLKAESPKEIAIGALLAAAAPRYRAMMLQERTARKAAEKRLSEYETTTPKLGAKPKETKAGEIPEDLDFTEAVMYGLEHRT